MKGEFSQIRRTWFIFMDWGDGVDVVVPELNMIEHLSPACAEAGLRNLKNL